MEMWIGFMFGLVGSPHCIGMCGPIALALPSGGYPFGLKWTGQIFMYNLGRAVTYGLMGAVLALVGSSVAGFGFQNEISMMVGAFMILMALIPGIAKKIFTHQAMLLMPQKITTIFQYLMQRHGFVSLFGIGLLNGLLPCGLVYMALIGALAMADWTKGMLSMLFFGLGTLPALFAVTFFGRMVGGKLRDKLSRLAPVFIGVLGLIFILRGMELGIPYLSPKSPPPVKIMHQETGTEQSCH